MPDEVKAWAEKVFIPTYKIGEPDKNPMFLEKRVYQGSSGVVYPHPVIDRVFDEKENKEYTALYLENRYLKIMILPEIGGRVQMALDKTNNYHFVYYNHVIKPALVGLAGPWISGGIEFNWPQHHRPSTFDPLDWLIQDNPDGSKTVWCAEIEHMFRTKGMHGFTLYPGQAFLKIHVQLYNRTALPQSFLWWANPAVHVHDDYQSVFPPDVHAVMDHGKRDVSSFPIATGTYYKVNYAPGTDISRYKNIPVPTSYMAYHSDFDFMGDYDFRADAGMLHIANHHIVPGKKQWTWGNGDFGQAWDRQLTDTDGPYIELMCGAYTDNQPDFSWIQPGEEKTFDQFFMPYKKIGPATNASQQAAIHLEIEQHTAHFGVYCSAERVVTITITCRGEIVYTKEIALDPENVLIHSVNLPVGTQPPEVTLCVEESGMLLLSYTPQPQENPEIPAPALPARPPEEIQSIEELYINGLHLEQYRHATYSPERYYQEALRRDPGDSRCNNAMGLLQYQHGKFAQAETYFRKAIQRLTLRNPNPYDGEPYYNLGLALNMQGKYEDAFQAFHKAVWNAAGQDSAYYELACLLSRCGGFSQALEYVASALSRNTRHHKARHLKIALLRHTGQVEDAQREITKSLQVDPLEYGAYSEQWLFDKDLSGKILTGRDPAARIEIALDYAHAGLWDDAIQLLEGLAVSDTLAAYTLAWIYYQSANKPAASSMFAYASGLSVDYCFPNRLEDVLIFTTAGKINPRDGHAAYLLGNFWYAHRQYEEAITCWENARSLDWKNATIHRNLGLAYFNKRGKPLEALACFEQAFALNPTDARVFFELDQLYKRLNNPLPERLDRLQQHIQLVAQRDDLMIEYISLLNLTGQFNKAYQQMMQHTFHPWEGGEGKVTGQYVINLVQQAKKRISEADAVGAIELLMRAQDFPHNLGEGKLYGAQENNIFYYLGIACELAGEVDAANSWFEKASSGLSEPASALYYNDQPPDMIFYQGLAHRKLLQMDEAQAIFMRLIAYGEQHRKDVVNVDYFAVSLPDFLVFDVDLNARNRLHCEYMIGLGKLGLGKIDEARAHFDAVLAADAYHTGATLHYKLTLE